MCVFNKGLKPTPSILLKTIDLAYRFVFRTGRSAVNESGRSSLIACFCENWEKAIRVGTTPQTLFCKVPITLCLNLASILYMSITYLMKLQAKARSDVRET